MKAQVNDYIKTEDGPRRVTRADDDNHEYHLENGVVIDDADVDYDDILLESEVV